MARLITVRNIHTTGGALLCPVRADLQMLGKFTLVSTKNASSAIKIAFNNLHITIWKVTLQTSCWPSPVAATRKRDRWGTPDYSPADSTFNCKISNQSATENSPINWTTIMTWLPLGDAVVAEGMPILTRDWLVEHTITGKTQTFKNLLPKKEKGWSGLRVINTLHGDRINFDIFYDKWCCLWLTLNLQLNTKGYQKTTTHKSSPWHQPSPNKSDMC